MAIIRHEGEDDSSLALFRHLTRRAAVDFFPHEVHMNKITRIHVELTPLQTHIIDETRRVMFPYTDDELQDLIVGLGVISLDRKYGQDDDAEAPGELAGQEPEAHKSELPRRQVAEQVTIQLPEDLRPRLESFLSRCPAFGESEALTYLIVLGMEALKELRVIRERDVMPGAESSP
jgi:hypothetical protein